jgi:hypothetical protein
MIALAQLVGYGIVIAFCSACLLPIIGTWLEERDKEGER